MSYMYVWRKRADSRLEGEEMVGENEVEEEPCRGR
jgi:hypothetical protein